MKFERLKDAIWKMAIFIIILSISILLVSCGEEKEEKNQVRVYCFGDYIDPELVGEFEEETGIKVVMDTFDTNEEMYPVLEKGSVKYDVICTSDYMVSKLMKKNLLAELDYENIPNIDNIDGEYLEIGQKFDQGNRHSVPHTWGTLGIMYNTKNIKKGTVTSWNDLWKKEYEGNIVMPDSMRDTFAIALKAKGYSINDCDEEHLKEASRYLSKQKKYVYKYANDSARDMLIGGYCDIAVVWSGEVIYSREEKPELQFVIPSEGSEEFMDMWAIPANAVSRENGEKWINFMLSKEASMKNYEYLTYSIPNRYVMDMIENEEDRRVLFPSDNVIESCELLHTLNTEYEDMYSRYWKLFKTE